jgi:hypothetical protein
MQWGRRFLLYERTTAGYEGPSATEAQTSVMVGKETFLPPAKRSTHDAVDGSPPRLQGMLPLLNQEESNGTDQSSWIGYREIGFPGTWR